MRLRSFECFVCFSTMIVAASSHAQDMEASLHGQHDHAANTEALGTNVQALIVQARTATEIYSDRRVAIANGYHLVGRDIPSMGEHWLSTKLVVDGRFDVSKPQMLTYLAVDGRPVLTGVVYVVPLQQGETTPAAFGPTALWHEHNGTVDEEGLLPEHHSTPGAVTGTRVAFLHAWTRIPNSDGVFSAENWAIPFVRLGLPVPKAFPNGTARALSLLSGGREFFLDMARVDSTSGVGKVLDECSSTAERLVESAKSQQRGLNQGELELLAAAWAKALTDVSRIAGADAAHRINGLVP